MRAPGDRYIAPVAGLVLVLLSLLGDALGAAAETDWPRWRGPTRNGVSAEASGWPSGWPPKRLWSRSVGRGCTSPIIVGGKLYVMGWQGTPSRRSRAKGTDTIYCLDARTGRELWKQSYPCPYQARVRTGDTGAYGGPSSTPTLDKATGWLYTLSIDGDLCCWDTAQQGKLVWRKNFYEAYTVRQRPHVGGGRRDYGFPTAPFVLGDLVVVEVGATEATVMAFDKRTGRRRWKSEYKRPAGHTGGPSPITVAGTPCLALLGLHDLVVMRTDPGHEGRTVATTPWQTEFACNIPTPGFVGSRVVLTSGYNHQETCLYEITPGSARRKWRARRVHALTASPVVYRDRVFLVCNQLQCLDLATGELKWKGGGFGNGSCLVAAGDGKVIVFGNGKVAVVDALADRYRELSRLDRLARGTCYPHVTLSNGVLAVKDRDGSLVCLSVRPVPDTTRPEIVSAFAPRPTELRVQFSEPVTKASAEDLGNYAIDYGVKISAARLDDEGTTVTLTVSPLREGGTYTLTIDGIADRAPKPNTIKAGSRAAFRYTPTRRVVDGLAALYGFEEGKGATVADVSGIGGAIPLTIAKPGAAKWVRGGLAITAPNAVRSAGPPTKLIDACRKTNEITVEAWLRPANTRQSGPARIVSLSKDPYHRNLTLGQERSGYDVRLRTTTTGENGMNPSLGARSGVATRLSHVVYTRDKQGKARLYVDGVLKVERTIGGDLSNWDTGFRFGLANELTSDRPWLGEFHLVAVYSRALTQPEVQTNHRAGPEGRAPAR